MDEFDSWIEDYPIKPPIGGVLRWGAKAHVKKTGTGRDDDAITLSEHLGETRGEAVSKADAEACEWIAQRRA